MEKGARGSRDDPRYTALRKGLEQLNRYQLTVLAEHVASGNPVVVDGCNYDPTRGTWCPLAVALDVPGVLRRDGIVVTTDEDAKRHIVSIGTRTNPGFGLNPMRGIVGRFFTRSRRSDLLQACREVLDEGTFYGMSSDSVTWRQRCPNAGCGE